MTFRFGICACGIALLAALATPTQAAGQERLRYKLVVSSTFGGPQSFFSGNISNHGKAVGVADTATPDPFYPNANPLIFTFADPFVFHAFEWKNGVMVDLGALPGTNSSWASFISESGLVSGQSINGAIDPLTGWPEEVAVLWKDGEIINLGTLGGYESGAGVVNSHGQIAGFSGNAVPDPYSLLVLGTQTRAFLWDKDHGMQDLGTLGGPDAFAPVINERGQVSGLSYTNSTPNPGTGLPTADPFLWAHGQMLDLGTLGGTLGGAAALNNRGQVVGQSNLEGDVIGHPFLWPGEDGKMLDLGTLGGSGGAANAINDAGNVVGISDTTTSTHAFLWRRGKMIDLGTVNDDCFSDALGINARSQVVGNSVSCDGTVGHTFLWENGHILNLNVFVPPDSGLTLVDAVNINDRGEIWGNAVRSDGTHRAFLLIPVGDDDPHGITASLQEGAVPATSAPTSSAVTAAIRARFVRRYYTHGVGRN
jgi:probable HAF family extracellular repeat protein